MRYHDLSWRDNIKFEIGGTLAAAPGDMREAGATTLIFISACSCSAPIVVFHRQFL
jgi:hypothetical protein